MNSMILNRINRNYTRNYLRFAGLNRKTSSLSQASSQVSSQGNPSSSAPEAKKHDGLASFMNANRPSGPQKPIQNDKNQIDDKSKPQAAQENKQPAQKSVQSLTAFLNSYRKTATPPSSPSPSPPLSVNNQPKQPNTTPVDGKLKENNENHNRPNQQPNKQQQQTNRNTNYNTNNNNTNYNHNSKDNKSSQDPSKPIQPSTASSSSSSSSFKLPSPFLNALNKGGGLGGSGIGRGGVSFGAFRSSQNTNTNNNKNNPNNNTTPTNNNDTLNSNNSSNMTTVPSAATQQQQPPSSSFRPTLAANEKQNSFNDALKKLEQLKQNNREREAQQRKGVETINNRNSYSSQQTTTTNTPHPNNNTMNTVINNNTSGNTSSSTSASARTSSSSNRVAPPRVVVQQEEEPEGPPALNLVISSVGIPIRDFSRQTQIRLEDLARKVGKEMGERDLARRITAVANNKDQDFLLEADMAELIALELGGFEVTRVTDRITSVDQSSLREAVIKGQGEGVQSSVVPRAPVVCIMGHVDHGKTTLLDSLRTKNNRTRVAGTEAGGITQKLSAFTITTSALDTPDQSSSSSDQRIVFLDTPGHAAFSLMRGQGALATDIVVLVVALDDGVQPQTIEAVQAAKKAKCSLIIALNKVDKFGGIGGGEGGIGNTGERNNRNEEKDKQRRKVLLELSARADLLAEDFGGEVPVVEVAGKSGLGLDTLLTTIGLTAESLSLAAANSGLAEAIVLDSRFEKGKGVVAEVLVRWGQLRAGDSVIVGTTIGKVRSLLDEDGESVKSALPSSLVKVLGFKELPESGIELLSVENEMKARTIIDRRTKLVATRQARMKTTSTATKKTTTASTSATTTNNSNNNKNSFRTDIASRSDNNTRGQNRNSNYKQFLEQQRQQQEEEEGQGPARPSFGVLLRADGAGTLDALQKIVSGVITSVSSFAELRIIHSGIGEIMSADLNRCAQSMAEQSGAAGNSESMVLAFNVGNPDNRIRSEFKLADIDIVTDNVIYRLEDALIEKLEEVLPRNRTVTSEVVFCL
jgi:translation initiation factor IF-2